MTGDVLLREVTAGDLAIFFEQQLDPEANAMAAFLPRDREAFMAHWARVLDDETGIEQTILFDGQVAGYIVAFEQSGEREVGYWIGRAYWGKRIATRALAAFLRQIQTRPLYAHVAKHNRASLRVLEKCGFTITGEDRDVSAVRGGEVEELVLMLDA